MYHFTHTHTHTVVKNKLSLPMPPSDVYLRATGPKTVHAERTLHFLSPQEYEAAKAADRATRKQLSQQYGVSLNRQRPRMKSPVKSTIVINSLNFEQNRCIEVLQPSLHT